MPTEMRKGPFEAFLSQQGQNLTLQRRIHLHASSVHSVAPLSSGGGKWLNRPIPWFDGLTTGLRCAGREPSAPSDRVTEDSGIPVWGPERAWADLQLLQCERSL